MSFLLYQDDNIVGVFDDLIKAKDYAQGIINNNWAKNFRIEKYKLNTLLKIKDIKVDEDEKEEEDSDTVEENDEVEKIDAAELQKKLNLLKIQKDKIEESKNKYDVDLKLYHEFKQKLEEDIQFTIPELFQEKYKIFHQLEQQNNLNWETFSLLYKEPDFHGKYSNIFEITNEFEEKFIQNSDSNTEESSDYESESDTNSDSDNVIEIIQVINSSDDDSESSN